MTMELSKEDYLELEEYENSLRKSEFVRRNAGTIVGLILGVLTLVGGYFIFAS